MSSDALCPIDQKECGQNGGSDVVMVVSNDGGLHFDQALWLNTNTDCVDEPVSRSDDNGTVWTTWNCPNGTTPAGIGTRYLQKTTFAANGSLIDQSPPVEISNLMGTLQLADTPFSTGRVGEVDMSVAGTGSTTTIAFAYDDFPNDDPAPSCTIPNPPTRQRWFLTYADVGNFPSLATTDFTTKLVHEDASWPVCMAPVPTGANVGWPRVRWYVNGPVAMALNTSVVKADGSPAGTRAVVYIGPYTGFEGTGTNPYPDTGIWDIHVPRCDGGWTTYSTDTGIVGQPLIPASRPIQVVDDGVCDQFMPSLATIPRDVSNGPSATVFWAWHDTRDGGTSRLTDMWYAVAQPRGIGDFTGSVRQQRLTPLDTGVPWASVDGVSHGHTPWGDYETMTAVPFDGRAYAAWADGRPNRDFDAQIPPSVWAGSFQ